MVWLYVAFLSVLYKLKVEHENKGPKTNLGRRSTAGSLRTYGYFYLLGFYWPQGRPRSFPRQVAIPSPIPAILSPNFLFKVDIDDGLAVIFQSAHERILLLRGCNYIDDNSLKSQALISQESFNSFIIVNHHSFVLRTSTSRYSHRDLGLMPAS